ncbi:MAG: DNA-3-methyladenine glycosylase [Clostridia bacterium]|nr:DNA-3-methyladenine glycosylase [Clostridia bacterium]
MPTSGVRLGRDFFARDTVTVARELLGKLMIYCSPKGLVGGRVVETEAYVGPEDPACHSARGLTPRNQVMFGPAGYAYIYQIYGMHYCFNVTTASDDRPEAVLLRALEPLIGLDIMFKHRRVKQERLLASGPGRLVQALGITKELNGSSVVEGPIGFYGDSGYTVSDDEIVAAPRIGISQAADWLLRFYLRGNPHVSKKWAGAP